MSEANRELVTRAFELLRAGAVERWLELVAPDIAWDISAHPLPDFPDRGEGRDAFAGHMAEYMSGWVAYEPTEVELFDRGEAVLELVHERASMRDTGVRLDREIAVVWNVRDGLLSRFRVFKTREEGLAALEG